MTELKPCPVCWAPAKLIQPDILGVHLWWMGACTECDFTAEVCSQDPDVAATSWNNIAKALTGGHNA